MFCKVYEHDGLQTLFVKDAGPHGMPGITLVLEMEDGRRVTHCLEYPTVDQRDTRFAQCDAEMARGLRANFEAELTGEQK